MKSMRAVAMLPTIPRTTNLRPSKFWNSKKGNSQNLLPKSELRSDCEEELITFSPFKITVNDNGSYDIMYDQPRKDDLTLFPEDREDNDDAQTCSDRTRSTQGTSECRDDISKPDDVSKREDVSEADPTIDNSPGLYDDGSTKRPHESLTTVHVDYDDASQPIEKSHRDKSFMAIGKKIKSSFRRRARKLFPKKKRISSKNSNTSDSSNCSFNSENEVGSAIPQATSKTLPKSQESTGKSSVFFRRMFKQQAKTTPPSQVGLEAGASSRSIDKIGTSHSEDATHSNDHKGFFHSFVHTPTKPFARLQDIDGQVMNSRKPQIFSDEIQNSMRYDPHVVLPTIDSLSCQENQLKDDGVDAAVVDVNDCNAEMASQAGTSIDTSEQSDDDDDQRSETIDFAYEVDYMDDWLSSMGYDCVGRYEYDTESSYSLSTRGDNDDKNEMDESIQASQSSTSHHKEDCVDELDKSDDSSPTSSNVHDGPPIRRVRFSETTTEYEITSVDDYMVSLADYSIDDEEDENEIWDIACYDHFDEDGSKAPSYHSKSDCLVLDPSKESYCLAPYGASNKCHAVVLENMQVVEHPNAVDVDNESKSTTKPPSIFQSLCRGMNPDEPQSIAPSEDSEDSFIKLENEFSGYLKQRAETLLQHYYLDHGIKAVNNHIADLWNTQHCLVAT